MVTRARLNFFVIRTLPVLLISPVLIVRVSSIYKLVAGEFIFNQVVNNHFMKPENSLLCLHQPTDT